VTHTAPRHFARLDRGSQNELITEFVAIRAAQRPKSTLQGIQASDLCNVTYVDQSAPEAQRSAVAIDKSASAAVHQSSQGSLLQPLGSTENSRTLRASPSIENFSRPAPWSPKAPTPPPPRTSSRKAFIRSAPAPATTKPVPGRNGKLEGDLLADAKSALHSRSYASDPHLSGSHAITTNDDSASPTSITTLPTQSHGTNSGLTTDLNIQAKSNIVADVGSLTILPLRHVSSCPTTKLLSQQHRRHRSRADQRPLESPQPIPITQWEDVVDYSYEQAAEADCNFDWSQKTVYVDGDVESTDTSTSESQSVEGSPSCNDEQSQDPGTNETRECSAALPSPDVATQNSVDLRHVSPSSVEELQDGLSPFGRHQSPREAGRYQPLPLTSSKPTSDLNVAPDSACVVDDAYLQKETCEGTELELSVDQSATPERYSSEESNSFSLRPLLNKYSSDGSLLSSTTSTIRTYRSSNSVGSLPELIYSLNNSRENFNGEKTSPTDSVASGSRPFPPRVPSATRLQLQAEKAIAERLQLSCSAQAFSAKDTASALPSMSPLSPISLPEVLGEPISKVEAARSTNAKAGATSVRQRSASAVTPGQSQRVRGSYSLFPTPQYPNHRQL
jgi:hypothetical protein